MAGKGRPKKIADRERQVLVENVGADPTATLEDIRQELMTSCRTTGSARLESSPQARG